MRNAAAVLLLVMLETGGSGSQISYDRDVGSKVMALELLAKKQAAEAKDLKTLDELLHESFVLVELNGDLLTKPDMLAYVSSADSIRYQAEDMIVRVHNDTAVVTGIFQATVVVHGKVSMRRGRFVDTWMLNNGRWLGIASVSAPAK